MGDQIRTRRAPGESPPDWSEVKMIGPASVRHLSFAHYSMRPDAMYSAFVARGNLATPVVAATGEGNCKRRAIRRDSRPGSSPLAVRSGNRAILDAERLGGRA